MLAARSFYKAEEKTEKSGKVVLYFLLQLTIAALAILLHAFFGKDGGEKSAVFALAGSVLHFLAIYNMR